MRQVIPVPGMSLKRAKTLSRQSRYAERHKRSGLCPRCGKEKLAVKPNGKPASLGPKCLKAQREVMHKRIGATRRNKNSLSYQLTSRPVSGTLIKPMAWDGPDAEACLRDSAVSNKTLASQFGVSEAAVRGRRQRLAKKDAKRRKAA